MPHKDKRIYTKERKEKQKLLVFNHNALCNWLLEFHCNSLNVLTTISKLCITHIPWDGQSNFQCISLPLTNNEIKTQSIFHTILVMDIKFQQKSKWWIPLLHHHGILNMEIQKQWHWFIYFLTCQDKISLQHYLRCNYCK